MTSPIELDLAARPLIAERLRQHPPEVSELTFTNLFVWRKSRPVHYLCLGESLVLLVPGSSREDWWAMGGAIGPQPAWPELRRAVPNLRGLVRLPESRVAALQADGLTCREDPDQADYVYRAEDLAELKGEKYHKKRNLVRQCLDAHECHYEPITAANRDECRDMQARWCDARNCAIDPGLCREYDAIREAFAHYDALELAGGAIRVNGKIEAYALGEALAPGVAVCHFEKAMPGVHGLGQLINQWFVQNALRGFDYVNREQDLGIPGLRQAKQSYHPHHRVRKFVAEVPTASTAPDDPRACDRIPGA
jgi:hypothetical protein